MQRSIGQLPEMTPEAIAAAMKRRKLYRPNTGEAWWVALDGPGPYDGPESLADSERCLTGFGSIVYDQAEIVSMALTASDFTCLQHEVP